MSQTSGCAHFLWCKYLLFWHSFLLLYYVIVKGILILFFWIHSSGNGLQFQPRVKAKTWYHIWKTQDKMVNILCACSYKRVFLLMVNATTKWGDDERLTQRSSQVGTLLLWHFVDEPTTPPEGSTLNSAPSASACSATSWAQQGSCFFNQSHWLLHSAASDAALMAKRRLWPLIARSLSKM